MITLLLFVSLCAFAVAAGGGSSQLVQSGLQRSDMFSRCSPAIALRQHSAQRAPDGMPLGYLGGGWLADPKDWRSQEPHAGVCEELCIVSRQLRPSLWANVSSIRGASPLERQEEPLSKIFIDWEEVPLISLTPPCHVCDSPCDWTRKRLTLHPPNRSNILLGFV